MQYEYYSDKSVHKPITLKEHYKANKEKKIRTKK